MIPIIADKIDNLVLALIDSLYNNFKKKNEDFFPIPFVLFSFLIVVGFGGSKLWGLQTLKWVATCMCGTMGFI